jgi:hypothetical protein
MAAMTPRENPNARVIVGPTTPVAINVRTAAAR